MSWPLVKPPWKHVKWLSWGPPQTNMWIMPPKLEHSEATSVQDTSGVLYNLKQQIESLDSKSEWEFLKRSSNPYELVFSQSQDTRIPSSVCSLRPLSRSFFKMVETSGAPFWNSNPSSAAFARMLLCPDMSETRIVWELPTSVGSMCS